MINTGYFFSSVKIDKELYWCCRDHGELIGLNIEDENLYYIGYKDYDGYLMIDYSAVLWGENKTLYGILYGGKYLFIYDIDNDNFTYYNINMSKYELDLYSDVVKSGDDLIIVPKHHDLLFVINVTNGDCQIKDLFGTKSSEVLNICSQDNKGRHFVYNNSTKRLLVYDDRFIKIDDREFCFNKEIQDFSVIENDRLIILTYDGLYEWLYLKDENDLELIYRTTDDICGEKYKWNVEIFANNNYVWLISSRRDVIKRVDLNNSSVRDILVPYDCKSMKKPINCVYTNNLKKTIVEEKCYFSMFNSDYIFIVDAKTSEEFFINRLFEKSSGIKHLVDFREDMTNQEGIIMHEGAIGLEGFLNII